MDTNHTIGANVRAEMSRQAVSQSAVAAALDLPQSAISKRLRGQTPFTAADLGRVADLLGIPVARLYADADADTAAGATP